MLRTLGKTTWEKININEVFAFKGCWSILCKISPTEAIFLDGTASWQMLTRWIEVKDQGKIFKYFKKGGFGTEKGNWMWKIPFGLLTLRSHYKTNNYLYKLPKSVQKLFKEE